MRPQIVEYAKERYIEEQKRFDHFENKCVRIMSFTTILIAATTSLLSFFSASLFQPITLLDYCIFIVSVVLVFVLMFSWSYALSSIKISSVNIAPRKEDHFTYMQESSEEEMYTHMLSCYIDPLEKLSSQIDSKAAYLRHSYNALTVGGWMISLLLSLTFAREIIKWLI